MREESNEPSWYGKARYVNEGLPDTNYPGLSCLAEEELETIDYCARMNDNHKLVKLVARESKRRYLGSVLSWIKEACIEMPETDDERRDYLDRANEIFRRGWNDHREELINIWSNIQDIAEDIAEELKDCPEKVRYQTSKQLVGALIVNFWEKDMQERIKSDK